MPIIFLNKFKDVDNFTRNIILVFLGASLVNFFNLLYQLLIAHRLTVSDFAAFNSLLSIFTVISAPSLPLQAAVAKYTAEFRAKDQIPKIKVLISGTLKISSVLAVLTFFIFSFVYLYIMDKLKISSVSSGYILAILLAFSWITPILLGGLQGLELFGWLTSVSLINGATKLISAFILIALGFSILGALGAFLVAVLLTFAISFFPLKNYFSLSKSENNINFKDFFLYLVPVTISSFCFANLVSLDMVLVKYYFSPQDSGLYSLAQMVGKIFLFLPGAIGIVMFPRTSGLSAKNMDTRSTLKKSLFYAFLICALAILFYNSFPAFILKILTGKVFLESINLGRLFSLSMSFFTLLFILVTYFLSIKDLHFIKYLFLFTLIQFLAIVFFHRSLMQVQLIVCINSILLFLIHLLLAFLNKKFLLKVDN